MRRCRDCLQLKPIADFPIAVAKTRTPRTRCLPCYRRYASSLSRADYQRHQKRRLVAAKRYRTDHAEAIKEHNRYNARQRQSDPEWQTHIQPSRRASKRVSQALKTGKLFRPDRCQKCKQVTKLEAAHYDYDQPLHVVWLCRSCHVQWDRTQPKLPFAHLQNSILLNFDA